MLDFFLGWKRRGGQKGSKKMDAQKSWKDTVWTSTHHSVVLFLSSPSTFLSRKQKNIKGPLCKGDLAPLLCKKPKSFPKILSTKLKVSGLPKEFCHVWVMLVHSRFTAKKKWKWTQYSEISFWKSNHFIIFWGILILMLAFKGSIPKTQVQFSSKNLKHLRGWCAILSCHKLIHRGFRVLFTPYGG